MIIPILDEMYPGWQEDVDQNFVSSSIIIAGAEMFAVSILATVVSSCLVHGARTG